MNLLTFSLSDHRCGRPSLQGVLSNDRPDIILLDNDTPILVVEQTVEVPSGHNVGQRFARLAAAATAGVPFLYFAPYVAMKHGGRTAGPRYVNARLFRTIDIMTAATGTAITTINWPVDEHFEVRRDREKDADVRDYMATFLELYERAPSLGAVNRALLHSTVHRQMIVERNTFVQTEIRRPEQYERPPESVKILTRQEFETRHRFVLNALPLVDHVVLYKIGMNYIRPDPYAGMSLLYRNLYVAEQPSHALVLWFPSITVAMWRAAAVNATRKDVRLYRLAADAILFRDALVQRAQL